MSRIIFIEGIPGSGKTTFSRRLSNFLFENGERVINFEEGDLHPIDLAWCSIIPKDKFKQLLIKHNKYSEQILKYSKLSNNNYITAYTKIRVDDKDINLYEDFEIYEIYRDNDYNHFKDTHFKLWKDFYYISEAETSYIFECIFLQNHINELILKFNKTEEEIITYFNDLIYCLKDFDVSLFYIRQNDVTKTLRKTIESRRYNPPYKDWIELVIEYIKNTNYGIKLGYIGEQGVIRYFKDRQDLETKVFYSLNIDKHIFYLDSDYEKIYQEMTKILSS